MSQLVILVIAAAAIMLALLLAYLPMRILLAQMAKKIAAPIRDFIQRQRDRRTAARETPERRKPAEFVPPRARQPRREQGRDRRDAPDTASPKS